MSELNVSQITCLSENRSEQCLFLLQEMQQFVQEHKIWMKKCQFNTNILYVEEEEKRYLIAHKVFSDFCVVEPTEHVGPSPVEPVESMHVRDFLLLSPLTSCWHPTRMDGIKTL